MTAYVALKSFSGIGTMRAGEVGELTDPAIIADLTRAGYIRENKATQEIKPKRTRKNGGVKNAD